VRTVPRTDTQCFIGGYLQVDGIATRRKQYGDEQDTFGVSTTPFVSYSKLTAALSPPRTMSSQEGQVAFAPSTRDAVSRRTLFGQIMRK
jgi:hypothetical protein